MTAIALTIAGSDSGGGAGIQADLKTFSALGVYGASVVTALTAQNTQGVQAIHPVPPAFVRAQMASVFDDLAVGAVKIGMLGDAALIETVAQALPERLLARTVLDPVMVAASGDRLVPDSAAAALLRWLIPRAALITPNLHEAAALLDDAIAATEADMQGQAHRLLEAGARAVLMKGGHLAGPESVDWLVMQEATLRFAAPRVATANTHGTGCTLASAIAAQLAKGAGLEDAVAGGKDFVSRALAASGRLSVGQGRGPTHHFHAWW
jgi:hydroxymethylpyrimidine/phosphomethylpyrimidine kinase